VVSLEAGRSWFRTATDGEPERTATEHSFVGALVNSTLGTNGNFLHNPRWEPLPERAERLGVPIYLHPGATPPTLERSCTRAFSRYELLRALPVGSGGSRHQTLTTARRRDAIPGRDKHRDGEYRPG
jgi:hypothetical protein